MSSTAPSRPVPPPWPEIDFAAFGTVEKRPLSRMPLSLSYDHRVINGADAARFVCFVGERLADERLLDD